MLSGVLRGEGGKRSKLSAMLLRTNLLAFAHLWYARNLSPSSENS